jgi:hypothetical protein
LPRLLLHCESRSKNGSHYIRLVPSRGDRDGSSHGWKYVMEDCDDSEGYEGYEGWETQKMKPAEAQ